MTASASDTIIRYPSTGRLRLLPRMPRHIMIIDDDAKYPHLLHANLNILHNYAADVTIMKSLGRALDILRTTKLDLLFVSETLRPSTSFSHIQRYITQAGYTGPIVACAIDCTNEKRKRLTADGAFRVLDRDETHTASLIAVITACLDVSARSDRASASFAAL
jgi:DNA-binding NtrC family response regulator